MLAPKASRWRDEDALARRVVYQASSRDPVVLVAGATMMVVIGLVAAWVPARRTLRIDPAMTIRES